MTYARTSDKHDSLRRIGSHATKGFGTGRIDILPPNAVEETYVSAREHFEAMNKRRGDVEREIISLNKRLFGVNPARFPDLAQRRDILAHEIDRLNKQLPSLRASARKAANESWSIAFYEQARAMLPFDLFRKIEDTVGRELGRPHQELPKDRSSKHMHRLAK